MSIPHSLLRSPLYSWGFNLIILDLNVLEGAPKWSEELEGSSCATWYWGFVSIFLALSFLSPGLLTNLVAFGRRRSFGIILVPWFSSENFSEVFWGNYLWWRSTSLVFFSLPSGLVVPWPRRFRGVIFPSLRQDLFLLPSFLGKGKKLRLDLLFRFSVTDWPCHVVILQSSVRSMPGSWARC